MGVPGPTLVKRSFSLTVSMTPPFACGLLALPHSASILLANRDNFQSQSWENMGTGAYPAIAGRERDGLCRGRGSGDHAATPTRPRDLPHPPAAVSAGC